MNLLFISDMNAAAVELLSKETTTEGDLATAETLLNECLLQVLQYREHAEGDEYDDNDFNEDRSRTFDNCPLVTPFNIHTYSVFRNHHFFCQDIYDGAFLLAADIPVCIEATIAVVRYNLGLIQHRIGNRNGNSAAYQQATTHYQKSFAILKEDHDLVESSAALLVLKAALCCNISHLYSVSFCDGSHPEILIDALRPIVLRMRGMVNRITQRDFDFFQVFLHVFEDMSHQSSVAAAAA
jgi:hypothetical protein